MSQSGIYFEESGTGTVSTLTGNSGGPISPVSGNINIVGSGGVNVAGAGNTLTITVSGSGFTWNNVVALNTAGAANNGYIMNYAGIGIITLPATAVIGETIRIIQGDGTVGRGYQINKGGNTLYRGSSTPATVTYTNSNAIGVVGGNNHGSTLLISIDVNTWSIVEEFGSNFSEA